MSGQEKRYQLVHPISVSTKSTVYYGTLSGFGSFKKDIAKFIDWVAGKNGGESYSFFE